ncbi:MAG: SLC13 family permease [Acidimicrobiales bacterium]|jgi:anion transporter|nr:SLC13 family permease [Acidimicrobiales bacterium]
MDRCNVLVTLPSPPVRRTPTTRRPAEVQRAALVLLAGTAVAWLLPGLDGTDARLTLAVFLATAGLWATTRLDETKVALGAVALLVVAGIVDPATAVAPATNPTTWLLVGAFALAAAVDRTTLPARLVAHTVRRARTVRGLFWWSTLAVGATAFVIPSTSGRAALLVPVHTSLAGALGDRRVSRALSLLLPVVVLFTAVASLLGAGAHLVTVQLLAEQGAPAPGFATWALLGVPVAAASAALACTTILRTFLTAEERRRPLDHDALATASRPPAGGTHADGVVRAVLVALLLGWVTEPWHGISAGVLVLGAVALLTLGPRRVRVLSAGDAGRAVSWDLVVFLLASLVLADALVDTGAADALAAGALRPVTDAPTLVVVLAILGVSLLAHLVVTSRTARSSVLIPIVVPVGLSAGLDPTAVAFLSTAAAGYCITLPASAKPVALFARLDGAYGPADLRRLSSRLLPAHLALFALFAFGVWPALGLPLHGTPSQGSAALDGAEIDAAGTTADPGDRPRWAPAPPTAPTTPGAPRPDTPAALDDAEAIGVAATTDPSTAPPPPPEAQAATNDTPATLDTGAPVELDAPLALEAPVEPLDPADELDEPRDEEAEPDDD